MSKATTIRISRDPNVSDIIGPTEAAEVLGVERTRIARYVRKGWMPPHIKVIGQSKVWVRVEVEQAATEIRERLGKRRAAAR